PSRRPARGRTRQRGRSARRCGPGAGGGRPGCPALRNAPASRSPGRSARRDHPSVDYCAGMPITWTGRPEADKLLETDPLALLIGLVLDQQVKMEKAFSGPYDLKLRLGHLDAEKIARMDPDTLDAVFRERPALHRFPGNMARRVQQLCQVMAEQYGGDAGAAARGGWAGSRVDR